MVATLLGSCQTNPNTRATPVVPSAAPPTAGAATEGEASAALRTFLQAQQNAELFVVDSAELVNVNDNTWQVLVPRTDWADRMPNRAAFEIDKSTGEVRALPVR
ncbi:hypothetical protein ASU33_13030 [Solirubrum puertoriconensis]|uniref:Uncharacterized protein n=2 Tax=Solirubrum puertoriconensis TaxID=1751427 RepID=A0A9X0L469_SOLP1|nr:hypothetical protein ASU33_13030 [Solirubrum puertoriconensis]